MILNDLGRILAIQDSTLWIVDTKKEYEDISSFWSENFPKLKCAIIRSFQSNGDIRKQNRLKMLFKNNPHIDELKNLDPSCLDISLIAQIYDAYCDEALNIHIALKVEDYRDNHGTTAQEIADILKVNKNNVLAWISHKKNMPKQAYSELKEKVLNFR
ncbi:hypothetical protein [Acinetobacter soli]|uniref:hypothetical protein n=1 Tax=Acinetobacter soli TaxID=487316 RepID=UPI00125E4D77|nr:hypothetical protein [Acinetobacter soli]